MGAQYLTDMFEPLLGLPCWGVHWDSQVNLNLEFGDPHLSIREPDPLGRSITSPYRWVQVDGDWGLWIFCAHWKLSGLLDMDPVTSSSSDRRIKWAAARLDGQRLTAVSVTARNASTRSPFDLGAVPEVRRFGPS